MITIKNVTLRNFLSVGAVTQAVDFNRGDLTLILGENLDLGGDGNRNGTGKTTIVQGLSYGLFGVPINNIRKDNLVNRTNAKNMLVTVEFNVEGTDYRIERGRKPNVLRLFINSDLQKQQDDAQGDSRETQQAIEKIIHMSSDMFRHIVALNTYGEPFLAMKTNDQKNIIEQLLAVTMLSEKAETIKNLIKETKDSIQSEEFRVKAIEDANKHIIEQINGLKRRQRLWETKHNEDLEASVAEYDELSKIDIASELQLHKDLQVYRQNKKINEAYDALVSRHQVWSDKRDSDVADFQKVYDKLNRIDIAGELEKHQQVAQYNQLVKDKAVQDKELTRLQGYLDRDTKLISKLEAELESLKEHKCYACGQEFHDEKHSKVLIDKESLLVEAEISIKANIKAFDNLTTNKIVLGNMPSTVYKTEAEAIKHSGELSNLLKKIEDKKAEVNPYDDQLVEIANSVVTLGAEPKTIYATEAEAIKHGSEVDNLLANIKAKHEEVDPYSEQIADMERTAVQKINFDTINALTRTQEHQKFLLDLLSSKDSFVRKKIIDQNLKYLNERLAHYLNKVGLPHQVVFKNDLSVEITELGRDLDFHNLSRGEMNRVILSLSWAFRDVWENLYTPINLLFIDELLDSGMDAVGIESSLGVLKEMSRNRNKSVWLVSHREDLSSRVNNVLRVVKENGFSQYETVADGI